MFTLLTEAPQFILTTWRQITSEAHCCSVPITGTTTSPWTDFRRRARRWTHPAFLMVSLFFLDCEIDQRALAPARAVRTSSSSCGVSWLNGVVRAWLLTSSRSTWNTVIPSQKYDLLTWNFAGSSDES
ncbi:hypothetical protein L798_13844 [Zootermopsis nevadensis]|uniref:Uncharacterized protein n=1 Tax=Zootermopsis nevadensis TaxID=136037 RepID=A0A067QTM4_ZOONE|nr:hypothetical protein L798_13844 [Zootermopsis nevadensis]